MKKTILLGVLLLSAAAAVAQESRQDVSFSGAGLFGPTIHGDNNVVETPTGALGLLLSYRYMLTPHSALELNYSFAQNNLKYIIGSANTSIYGTYHLRIHSREQEATTAYVYSWTKKRYNPFVEIGVGMLIFTPVLDFETTVLDTRSSKEIAGLVGSGLAYELSPSFDIRVEYRGFLARTPNFGETLPSLNITTNRYQFISMPTLGVAYHF